MLLNTPFLPDPAYVHFLNSLGPLLHSVHFSLEDPGLCDARIRLRSTNEDTLIRLLKSLSKPAKYLLANGRYQPFESYHNTDERRYLLKKMERLYVEGVLDGIVFSDPYLLFALSDAAPDWITRIEAVPSINFMIDSAPKLEAVLDIIHHSRFRQPRKLTLDRLLNRRPAALSDLVGIIRHRCPGVRIELLVNEGCLNLCPFRSTHEALIAEANTGKGKGTLPLNRDLGCMRLLSDSPHRILSSPFIRPEDTSRYNGIADIFKICGRTLGTNFLIRTITAYEKGRHSGNLLALFDAANWMAAKWDISNTDLPPDFIDILTSCRQDCHRCATCQDLFLRHAKLSRFQLEDHRSDRAPIPDGFT